MKALHTLLFLGLFGLLSACSYTLTLDLGSQTLNLSDLPPSNPFGDTEYVIFPSTPQEFTPPPLDVVKGIRIIGEARADTPLNTTLEIYGRLEDPGESLSCLLLKNLVLCPRNAAGERLGVLAFTNQSHTTFSLTGSTLLQGVKEGRIWFGIGVVGTFPAGLTELRLENLKAQVTVGL